MDRPTSSEVPAPEMQQNPQPDQTYGDGQNWDQSGMFPGQPEPEYLIMEWLADSRVVRQRSREYYSSLAVIVLLVSLILFFANQVLLIFVMLSMLFIAYVLASVKADTVHNMVTTYGIRYRDRLYYWEQLGRFWIRPNGEVDQVHIELPGSMMGQLILLPSSEQSPIPVGAGDIVDVLSRYLVFEEPIPSQIDRWVEWIEQKFPLESKRRAKPVTPSKVEQPTAQPTEKPAEPPKR